MGALSINDIKHREVPLVFGFGGGVNSMAGLILLQRHGIRPDLISFADTKGEKPETYNYLSEFAQIWCLEHQFPQITIVNKESPRTGDVSLEEECLRRETMPSRAFGMSSCAMRWKIEPQEKFLNHWPPALDAWVKGQKPIKVLGIDAGEDHRAKISEDSKLRYWYPLVEFDLDREACVELIINEGLPVPPKSACFYCPSSTKSEILTLAREHPDLYARAVTLETKALTSLRHDLRNVKGLGRHWPWKGLLEADEKARLELSETPVEACIICTSGA